MMLYRIKKFFQNEQGAGVVEYVLIAVAASALILASTRAIHTILTSGLTTTTHNLNNSDKAAKQSLSGH